MIHSFIAEQTQANLNFQIELQKDKRVYCFIGENGAGKTQLLETMAKSFLYCHSLITPETKYYQSMFLRDDVNQSIKEFKLFLSKQIMINGTICKDRISEPWDWGEFSQLIMKQRGKVFSNPIVFIGAKNRGYAKNIKKMNINFFGNKSERFLTSFVKSFNYMNAYLTNEEAVIDWFASRLLVNSNFVVGQDPAIDEVILLCNLLQDLEPIKLQNLYNVSDAKNIFNIFFSDGQVFFADVPFEKLSTGYISIIKIFQDIVDGFSAWRLDDTEDISQMEGIVFIDEIEAHLHPKWEQNIIPLLKKHFPKATFYVATHSPIVIASTDEGEAYELIRDEQNNITARELGNPKAWYMADIYSQAFHVVQSQEAKDEQVELITLTAKYSALVKDYVKSKNDAKKQEIEIVFEQLDKAMAATDPRRITLENLKTLVQ